MFRRYGLKKRFLLGSISLLVVIAGLGLGIFYWLLSTGSAPASLLTLGLAGFFLLSGISGILMISKLMVQPILQLTDALQRVQRGDLDIRLKSARTLNPADEMDWLLHAFNQMVTRLQANIAELQQAKEEAERSSRQLRESNKKLEAIFAGIPDGIMIVDRRYHISYINPVMEKIMDKPAEAVIGTACYASCQGFESRCSFCRADSVFQLGGQAFTMCTKAAKNGDEERIMEIHDFPLLNERGEVEHVIEYVRDVTEAAKTQRNLEHARHLAELGKMASVVAHEVRNPLHAIAGAVRYLQGEITDSQLRSYLDLIDEQVARVNGVTDEMLSYARPLTVEFNLTQLKPILLQALEMIRPILAEKRIELITELEDPLPLLPLDRLQVQRVFVNLLQNALEAMAPGGKLQISASYHRHVPANRRPHVEVCITDDGQGLGDREPEELFKPFVTTKVRGTGLGLAIVRKIMDGHQGTVHLIPNAGCGTTAVVRFPTTLKVYEAEKHHFSYR